MVKRFGGLQTLPEPDQLDGIHVVQHREEIAGRRLDVNCVAEFHHQQAQRREVIEPLGP